MDVRVGSMSMSKSMSCSTSIAFGLVKPLLSKPTRKLSFTYSSSSSSSNKSRSWRRRTKSCLQSHDHLPNSPSTSSDDSQDLRAVLQLATPSELLHLHSILFRPSYLSPLLKSVPKSLQVDSFMIEHDFHERHQFVTALESRFFFLAADARSTLRGWRPSYRSVLLDIRKLLNVPCSTKLSVDDLELEIFIFIIHHSSGTGNTALRIGAAELCSSLLKGGQLVSLLKITELVSTKLSGKMLLETTKHKFGNEAIKKALGGATARYLGIGSLASLFGPMLWGTFLADVVIQMLGTDYIRILQAVYALAQIRILRRHGLHLDKLETGF